jgi:hypothetical protein
MIIWVRNIVLILFVLTLIYLALSTLSRVRKRRQLKLVYDPAKDKTSQDEFIAQGLKTYDRSLKPKLFMGVYLFPLALILVLGYLAQHT